MLGEVARIAHLLGVVLWVGALATAGVVALVGRGEGRRAVLEAARTAVRAVSTPGLLLAWLGGLAMLASGWSLVYSHAGWMHGKLTIGIVLSALHGVLLARLRKAGDQGEEAARRPIAIVTVAVVVLALGAIALVVARPG